MKRIPSSYGLAIVELLVVVAIIAALAALSFPVFARAMENARRATCKSNLHQIGIAASMYRQDYDGLDPEKGLQLSHSQMGLPEFWSMDVFETQYVKNRGILFCPSYTGSRARRTRPWGVGSTVSTQVTTARRCRSSY